MTADSHKALFVPFDKGRLPWPGPEQTLLYVYGAPGPHMASLKKSRLTVFQPWASQTESLQAQGCEIVTEIDEDTAYDYVLIHAPRQKNEARHALAQGLAALKPGGILVAAAANDAGGKRLAGDFEALGLTSHEIQKHKSRIVYAENTQNIHTDIQETWIKIGAPQPVCDGAYVSQPGIFGWDRIDAGSKLLAKTLPENLRGKIADFGCGFGTLGDSCLRRFDGITLFDSYDADARAVYCCRQNLENIKHNAVRNYIWTDLQNPENVTRQYDAIVMNPPFHEGKATANSLGKALICTAAQSLQPGGALYMVANTHLPYEDMLAADFKTYNIVKQAKGFKVIHAVK